MNLQSPNSEGRQTPIQDAEAARRMCVTEILLVSGEFSAAWCAREFALPATMISFHTKKCKGGVVEESEATPKPESNDFNYAER